MRLELLLPVIALLGAGGCAARKPVGAPEGWPRRADWIVNGKTGERADFDRLVEDVAMADVVFVGEDHDEPAHHAAHVRLAERLIAKRADLGFGMEMLQTTAQPMLDRYLAREIDLQTFAREVRWEKTWGFPIALYRPLLELARDRKAPIRALNAPAEQVRRLSTAGMDGLTAEERAALPEMDLTNEAHARLVRDAFTQHHEMPEDRFRRFYAVQVLWDETMAHQTVEAMKRGPVMVIAGTGHLVRRLGIPSRVERRMPQARTRVVLPITGRPGVSAELEAAVTRGDADWLWVTGPSRNP